MPIWPLHDATSWQKSAMHMDADAVLTQGGQLQVHTHTWCTWALKGFTGGCLVMVADANETVIHQWLVWPRGVDGTWIGRSDREDYETQDVPVEVLSRADHLVVACSHMPKDRFFDILDEVGAKAKAAKDLMESFFD